MPYVMLVYVPDDDEPDLTEWQFDAGEKLVGMYRIPARDEHTCSGQCGMSDKKKNGFGRHPDYGYDTHLCGHPTTFWRTGIGNRLVPALGYNLLEDETTPAIFRNPDQRYRLARQRKRR